MSSCVIWPGALSSGYGEIKVHGQRIKAHRYIYQSIYGPIPVGLQINHHCDVRACINPAHLELGTQSQNIMAAVRRGRWIQAGQSLPGEKNPRAKISAVVALKIRNSTWSLSKLGKIYGLSKSQISRIKRRESWKHI